MTMEAPLLTAFVATAGAVLIAVIGLIASVHYRLGKLEEGQKTLPQEDAHTREMVAKGDAHTQELISQTREMLTQEITRTREMAAQENAHTRELLSQLIMQETAALRERFDAQHAETMAAIQRLTDAFLSHSHDADGTVRFRIPPPAALPPDE